MAYDLKLPITKDSRTGYKTLQSLDETIFQQLKILLLTDKYEKVDDPDYGCGLYRYVLEYDTPELRNNIVSLISEQASKYMPYVTLSDFIFEKKNDVLYLSIKYQIGSLENTGIITTKINTNI